MPKSSSWLEIINDCRVSPRLKKLEARAIKFENERSQWAHEYLDAKRKKRNTKGCKKERDQRPLKNNDNTAPSSPVHTSKAIQSSRYPKQLSGNKDPVLSHVIKSSMAIDASPPMDEVKSPITSTPNPRPIEAYLHLDAQFESLQAKLMKQQRNLKSTTRKISAARYDAAKLQDHYILELSTQNARIAKNAERCKKYKEDMSNAEATKVLCTSLQNDIDNKLLPQIEELKQEVARKTNEWNKERESLTKELSEAVAHSESWELQCDKIGDTLAGFAEELKKRSVRPSDSSALVEELRNTIADLKLNGEKTEQEIENLKQALCEKQEDMAVLLSSNRGLTAKIEESQHEMEHLNRSLSRKETDARYLESSNDTLRAKIKEMEQQIKDQAPLVEIGVDIRTRFLEQERILHYSQDNANKEDLRYDILYKGHAAASRGNAVADAALFKTSRVSKELEETFQRMYR